MPSGFIWISKPPAGLKGESHPASNSKQETQIGVVFMMLQAQRRGERWRRTPSARICKEAPSAAIRSTEKLAINRM
jgi:hypothetical protein